MALSYGQLEQAWITGGGSRALAPLMAAIALAESGGRPDVTNPTDNNGTQTSWGLWQISDGTHNQPAPNWNDPVENARLAVQKYKDQGLGAWGTYTTGLYQQYYRGGTPVSALPQGGGGAGKTTAGGGGGIGGVVTDIASGLALPVSWAEGLLSGPSDVAKALIGVASPFVKLVEALDWLFHPSHWIRIFAGIGGGIMMIGGAWQLSHTGGEGVPVSAYGVSTTVGVPRAASLPMGILFVGIGGILLFVAFHNLPDTVGTFPELLGHITDEIKAGSTKAAA
jgi:hypothetical protein